MALAAAVFVSAWLALAGGAATIVAIALQGRTHRLEATAPVPFSGPFDVVAWLFVEQWVTFPRYVATRGVARAWRAADPRR